MKRKFSLLLAILLTLSIFLAGCSKTAGEIGGALLDVLIEELDTQTQSASPATTEPERKQPATRETAAPKDTEPSQEADPVQAEHKIREDGTYTSKQDVADYIHQYGHLPDNYITKKDAQSLGWVNSEGNLNKVAPGKSIGGDYFGNYEGLLPKKKGRKYYECDIDFDGGYRNGKRIIYSNDGLIYYSDNHYESFTLLYGEE